VAGQRRGQREKGKTGENDQVPRRQREGPQKSAPDSKNTKGVLKGGQSNDTSWGRKEIPKKNGKIFKKKGRGRAGAPKQ